MNAVDRYLKLYAEANCRYALPGLFDSKAPRLAIRALDYCLDCPVTRLCREVVLAPYEGERAYFDGVAGGRVWSKGRDITESALARADEESQREADQAAGRIVPAATRAYRPIRWREVERTIRGRPHEPLTSAEKVAVCLVAWDYGLTSAEAARLLGITPKTVRQYRSDARLNDDDKRHAAFLAVQMAADTGEAA